ncbi:hypothetical protein PPYR_07856 [Photinus pyralis]|uniref:Small ribosomal subunit protein uS10 domain-containing protein n=1 Tax=Photinus pyralis TaxID=7054 RepID=A0A1Y1MN04_PHOPY|nr:probable 28S ribosomal protein S10, mitochondrial [Photinus pyralis]KAB0799976.1 hypothetical protein PPYR_07856 [Photinus pyralis]
MFLRNVWTFSRNFALKNRRLYSTDLYEPNYLQHFKPKIPAYDIINVQIHGHDYCILESYQKWLHNMMKNMNLDVENGWATPAQQLKINTFKPNTEIVNSQFDLQVYERTLQINMITSLQLATLLRVLDSSAPAGVTVNVSKHEQYHEDVRYVPDLELASLKDQLDTLGGPRKK